MRVAEPELMLDERQCKSYNENTADRTTLNNYIDLYKQLINVTSGNVIDLGSGSCNFVVALAKAFSNLDFTCYELSSAMISIAEKNIKDFDNIKLVQDDLLSASGKYDVVLANRVLHHINDTERFWNTVNNLGKNILVVDINRPINTDLNLNIADPVYKEDIINSIKSSYNIQEVNEQIKNYSYNIYSDDTGKLIIYHIK
jgi:2-polyprenyl-3-methyl-5-hydroxy-6-metoxy-1,4-benzoquinol methylase